VATFWEELVPDGPKIIMQTVHSPVVKNAAPRLSGALRSGHARRAATAGESTGQSSGRGSGKWLLLLSYDEPWKGSRLDGRDLTLPLGIY
jgi:putative transposase